MNSNIFDRLSFLSLFLVIVLLPIFCLPFTNIPIETSKGLLLVVGLTFCVICWAIARFLDGRIVFPKSWLLVSGFGIVLIFLLSAMFSGSPQVSLFGTMFDIGSFWFIFSAFVLMFMCSIVFRTQKRAKAVLLGTIVSSVLVLIFQSAHLFWPKIFSLGILNVTDKTANILGSWNALGLFAGFSGLMFLLMIEFFPISKKEKLFLTIFILLSIILAVSVNFPLVWILLGVSSLIIFVYKASITLEKNKEKEDEKEKKQFPLISFIVVIVSLLFFMSAGFINNIIPNRLQISNSDVSPSFGVTMSITKGILTKDPVFGVGPNRFGEAWAMHKPVSINNTQFWDISFNSGSGLLPTLFATTGGLGILAFIVFFVLFLVIGTKSVFSSIKNKVNWGMMAFFVLSLYLFISSFFYFTGSVIFLLSLAFTGVFIGLTASSSSSEEISMSFLNDHRKSFFSMLFIILLIISSAAIAFKYAERLASVTYFQKSLTAENVPDALAAISKALTLHPNDLYLRTYSQVYFVKLNSLIQKKETELTDADKAELKTSLEQAIAGMKGAIDYNPKNYFNFQSLGSLYETLGSLGVKDAYTMAVESYNAASLLDPKNPGLKLAMAVASFADKKNAPAKDYVKAALTLKPDYVDAWIIMAEIAKSEGDNKSALAYGEAALSIIPANENLIKYVDSLRKGSSESTAISPVTTASSDPTPKIKDSSVKKKP